MLADERYILDGNPVTLKHTATLNDDKTTRDVYSDKYVGLKKQIINELKK